jgi:uncharacterized protein (DUF1697 family)
MPKHIAFLRAINLGGRTVKMDHLKKVFEDLGLARVETFIASGNVIFETRVKDRAAIEARIAAELQRVLGFEVATFVRTSTELAAVADYLPFPKPMIEAAVAYNVAFLASEVEKERTAAMLRLGNELHDFHVHGREMYWLSKVRQSEAKFKTNDFERALGVKMTLRGINTVRRMAERWCR